MGWDWGESAHRGRDHASSSEGRTDESANAGRQRHRQRAPERDPQRRLEDGRAPGPRTDRAKQPKEYERRDRHDRNKHRRRRDQDHRERQHRPRCEGARRRQGRLDRTGGRHLRDAELIPRMGAERVLRHQLIGDLSREARFDAALDVDQGELLVLEGGLARELRSLARKIGLLGVGLRADRNVLACRHGHGASDQPGDAGDQHLRTRGRGSRHTDDQARRRDEPVIGAEYGCPQPADARHKVAFGMQTAHDFLRRPPLVPSGPGWRSCP